MNENGPSVGHFCFVEKDMKKLFACYERCAFGWSLVVYHDEKPTKKVGAQESERSNWFEVPQDMIDVDGSPRMGLIQKAFPNDRV